MKNIKDKSEVNKFNILRMHAKSCKIAAAQVHIKHKRNAIILIITIAKGIKFVMIKARENFLFYPYEYQSPQKHQLGHKAENEYNKIHLQYNNLKHLLRYNIVLYW